jgi:uncharacterized protein
MLHLVKALAVSLLVCVAVVAQNDATPAMPVGSWQGQLEVGVTKLSLVLHIATGADGLTATLDSPDQGATGIAVDAVGYRDGLLEFSIKGLRASYKGRWDEAKSAFSGTFKQGIDLPLELQRAELGAGKINRPQTPSGERPYDEEDVYYSHDPRADTRASFKVAGDAGDATDRVRLAGSLTLPRGKGPHPAVVLISGSGPQDRDELILGHRPFMVLADALTQRGIAVLRFDDRGVGKSTGDFSSATSADFAKDALAGVLYLLSRPEISPSKIGLIGHSEGGLIAPMVAADSDEVGFVVMLAGPGVNGAEVVLRQSAVIGEHQGMTAEKIAAGEKVNRAIFEVLKTEKDDVALRKSVAALLTNAYGELSTAEKAAAGDVDTFVDANVAKLLSVWFRFFLTYEPGPCLAKITCPVLALNGSLDQQVLPDQNLPPIRMAFQNHEDAQVVELAGLNHLFQNCKTGGLEEYGQIEETFDPATLKLIADWISKRFL